MIVFLSGIFDKLLFKQLKTVYDGISTSDCPKERDRAVVSKPKTSFKILDTNQIKTTIISAKPGDLVLCWLANA